MDKIIKRILHLSMLSPKGKGCGGNRDNHGSLIVRSVPRVEILIARDVTRVAMTNYFCPRGGEFDQLFCPKGEEFDQLFRPRGEEFEFFLRKMSKSPPHAPLSPPPPSSPALILIGALHLGNLEKGGQ